MTKLDSRAKVTPFRRQVGATVSILIVLWVGCGGGERGKVSGTVQYHDGKPAAGVRVMARSDATGKSASGYTDANGKYELGTMEAGEPLLPGEYYVVVLEDRGSMDNPKPATIPPKYRSSATSGLKFVVEPGTSMMFDVKLDQR